MDDCHDALSKKLKNQTWHCNALPYTNWASQTK